MIVTHIQYFTTQDILLQTLDESEPGDGVDAVERAGVVVAAHGPPIIAL